jgi:hypothetical protein
VFVRLRQAATVLLKDIGHHWHPAGAEVEIPDEHFDPALHEDLSPPPEAGASVSPADVPAADSEVKTE